MLQYAWHCAKSFTFSYLIHMLLYEAKELSDYFFVFRIDYSYSHYAILPFLFLGCVG